MKRLSSAVAAVALAAASGGANAAVTDYVSKVDLRTDGITITGVLRNTATPFTLALADNVNGEFRYNVSRCVPVVLTMLEKPGKYYLNVTGDTADTGIGLKKCGLETRS